jgi:hypothetical protein
MKIKGEYRDVLSRNGEVIVDTGWQSNVIVADYGRFLAALMKKDFEEKVGIEYMAVGSGSKGYADFKSRVKSFFGLESLEQPYKPESEGYWVWAKKIDVRDIKYLNPEDDKEVDTVTNRLRIDVKFGKNEPSKETLGFEEFALLGIDKDDGNFDLKKLFFINYVNHGLITKDENMELTRSIILTFPIGKEEVVS